MSTPGNRAYHGNQKLSLHRSLQISLDAYISGSVGKIPMNAIYAFFNWHENQRGPAISLGAGVVIESYVNPNSMHYRHGMVYCKSLSAIVNVTLLK